MSDQVGLNDLIELLRAARGRGEPIPEGLIERERRGGDPCRLASALTLATFRSQDPHQSIEWASEAIELFAAVDCDCVELEFAAFNMLGFFLDDVGRYDEAAQAFEAALARSEKDDYFLGISKAQHNLCFQALRKGALHEIVRRTWDMLSHESADPTLRSDVATAYAELLTCVGLYEAATLKHRLAVAESDRSGDMLNGFQARIRLAVCSLLAGDPATGSQVAQELRDWPIGGVERYETGLRLLEIERSIQLGRYDQAERRLARLSPTRSTSTGFEGLNEHLTRARFFEATGEFEEAIAAASPLDLGVEAFSHDQARADEIIYRASKRLGRRDLKVKYGRRICARLAEWSNSLDALPQFEATGELTISRQVAGVAQRHALLDRLATIALDKSRVVAHEVRNALAPVTMAASLPTDAGLGDSARRRLVETVAQAFDKLDFVESRLDVSAPVVAHPGPVDVADLVAEVASSFARTARSKSIELVTTAEPVVIQSDRAIIDMALSNVISNAIKFTRPHTDVRIDLSAAGDSCVISVADQGSGFTAADIEQAFRPHARLSARPTAGETSTGLGLYISRRMLAGIGATITIDNRRDGKAGAQVLVRLPNDLAGRAESPTANNRHRHHDRLGDRRSLADGAQGPTRVLVVEDNPPIVDLVTAILRGAGVDVLAAASLQDVALVLTSKGHFDLALIDVDLGGEPAGAQVAALLRRERPDTRLLIASSMSAAEVGRYPSLRGLPFLPKPYNAPTLLGAVLGGSPTQTGLQMIGPGAPDPVMPVEKRFRDLEVAAEAAARRDPAAGADAYREALAFAGLYEHRAGVSRALWRLSELSAATGRFASRIDSLIELASSDLTGPIDRARALQALGWAYLDRRATSRAAHMFAAAADHTPPGHHLAATLEVGVSVCDLVAAGAENPDRARATLGGVSSPDLSDSPFRGSIEVWANEIEALEAIRVGEPAPVEADPERLPRAWLEHLVAGPSPTDADIDELARRRRQDVRDLFSVYDLFSERAALSNRRDLDAELASLNDDLCETLARSSEHTERYMGRVRELLNRVTSDRSNSDPGQGLVAAMLDEMDRAADDYDRETQLLSRPKLLTPLPIVVAHLIRATQRLATERRVVLVWSPFAPGSAIDGAALAELQATLTDHIAGLAPGSTVEVGLELDPPAITTAQISSPVN